MTNYFDDDPFWDEPASDPTGTVGRADATSQITRVNKRVPRRTRSHHVVIKDPTRGAARPHAGRPHDFADDVADDGSDEMWLEPVSRFGSGTTRFGVLGGIDPRLITGGAVVVAGVLAVAMFSAFGGDDGDNGFRSVAEADATTSTVLAITPQTVPTTEIVITAAVNPDLVSDDSDDSDDSDSQTQSGNDGPSTGGGQQVAALRTPASCTNRYEVVAGDFWLGIAERADVGLDDLLAANGATNDTAIYPGSEVCLPDGASIGSGGSGGAAPGGAGGGAAVDPATCANTYEVVAGDYWVRIADASGVELADVLEVNGANRDSMLLPGKTICLPAGANSPTPSTPPPTAPPTTAAPATTAAPTTAAPTTAPATTAAPPTDPPTTQAPATTRPPAPVPSGGQVEAMIRAIWPDDQEEQAVRIAWRESNFRPNVTSSTGCCVGVFQIHWEAHRGWMAEIGITSRDQLFDARTNIEAAYALYQRNGWAPWAATYG